MLLLVVEVFLFLCVFGCIVCSMVLDTMLHITHILSVIVALWCQHGLVSIYQTQPQIFREIFSFIFRYTFFHCTICAINIYEKLF